MIDSATFSEPFWSLFNKLEIGLGALSSPEPLFDAHVVRWLHVDLEHLFEEQTVLILDFTHAFALLEFLLVVIGNVSWPGRPFHVHLRFYVPQSLHVHDVLFHFLPLCYYSIRSGLHPH